jgi:VanZ family protein
VSAVHRWAPVVIWAAVVFILSTGWFRDARTADLIVPVLARLLPGASEPTLQAVHAAIRKLAHLGEYLVLGLLLARAVGAGACWSRRTGALAIAMAVTWAVADEAHQLWVPGRGAAVADVLIDSAGAVGAQLLLARRGASLRGAVSPRPAS